MNVLKQKINKRIISFILVYALLGLNVCSTVSDIPRLETEKISEQTTLAAQVSLSEPVLWTAFENALQAGNPANSGLNTKFFIRSNALFSDKTVAPAPFWQRILQSRGTKIAAAGIFFVSFFLSPALGGVFLAILTIAGAKYAFLGKDRKLFSSLLILAMLSGNACNLAYLNRAQDEKTITTEDGFAAITGALQELPEAAQTLQSLLLQPRQEITALFVALKGEFAGTYKHGEALELTVNFLDDKGKDHSLKLIFDRRQLTRSGFGMYFKFVLRAILLDDVSISFTAGLDLTQEQLDALAEEIKNGFADEIAGGKIAIANISEILNMNGRIKIISITAKTLGGGKINLDDLIFIIVQKKPDTEPPESEELEWDGKIEVAYGVSVPSFVPRLFGVPPAHAGEGEKVWGAVKEKGGLVEYAVGKTIIPGKKASFPGMAELINKLVLEAKGEQPRGLFLSVNGRFESVSKDGRLRVIIDYKDEQGQDHSLIVTFPARDDKNLDQRFVMELRSKSPGTGEWEKKLVSPKAGLETLLSPEELEQLAETVRKAFAGERIMVNITPLMEAVKITRVSFESEGDNFRLIRCNLLSLPLHRAGHFQFPIELAGLAGKISEARQNPVVANPVIIETEFRTPQGIRVKLNYFPSTGMLVRHETAPDGRENIITYQLEGGAWQKVYEKINPSAAINNIAFFLPVPMLPIDSSI